jgi:hypothetical protein
MRLVPVFILSVAAVSAQAAGKRQIMASRYTGYLGCKSRGQSSLRLLERRFILSRDRREAHTLENCHTAGSQLLARSLSCPPYFSPPRDQTTGSDRPTPGPQSLKGPDCFCENIRAGTLQSRNTNSPRAPHLFPISRRDSFSRQQTRPASRPNGESHS